jgi:outer membrane receptor protein involved in Fe transport
VSLSLVNLLELEELVDASEPSSLLIEDGEYDDPHWRGQLELSYALDNLLVNWNLRYIGDSRIDVQESAEFYSPDRVPQVVYNDLYASYDLPSDTRLYAGINNMFDRHPPSNPATYRGAFDGSLYDNVGRFFFVGASMGF